MQMSFSSITRLGLDFRFQEDTNMFVLFLLVCLFCFFLKFKSKSQSYLLLNWKSEFVIHVAVLASFPVSKKS